MSVFSLMRIQAGFKQYPEDFLVDERLGFSASGEGQHYLLHVEKRSRNTHDVIRHLARVCKVPRTAIGYSGLKDKQAVARQYFSVDLAGKPMPDLSQLKAEGVDILSAEKHSRKLKVGSHQANQFEIILRAVQGDQEEINDTLKQIKVTGVPNYFGSQRFGYDHSNILQVIAMFKGSLEVKQRQKRGMLLSAARALLFNAICAKRVTDGSWNRYIEGDILQLNGSQSLFVVEDESLPQLQQRLDAFDIHPTAPLLGVGGMEASGAAKALEDMAVADFQVFSKGLAQSKVKGMRRALRVEVQDLDWHWQAENLHLRFLLTRGAFATTVLDAL